MAEELRRRAVGYLTARDEGYENSRRELGVTDEVAAIDGLTPGMLVVLGENKIKTLDDLGDLATDELIDGTEGVLREFDLGEEVANAIIMAARAHWFEDEELESDASDGGGDENGSSGAAEEAGAGEAT